MHKYIILLSIIFKKKKLIIFEHYTKNMKNFNKNQNKL